MTILAARAARQAAGIREQGWWEEAARVSLGAQRARAASSARAVCRGSAKSDGRSDGKKEMLRRVHAAFGAYLDTNLDAHAQTMENVRMTQAP